MKLQATFLQAKTALNYVTLLKKHPWLSVKPKTGLKRALLYKSPLGRNFGRVRPLLTLKADHTVVKSWLHFCSCLSFSLVLRLQGWSVAKNLGARFDSCLRSLLPVNLPCPILVRFSSYITDHGILTIQDRSEGDPTASGIVARAVVSLGSEGRCFNLEWLWLLTTFISKSSFTLTVTRGAWTGSIYSGFWVLV